MGHNKIKWNINLEKGNEIAHSTIIEILREHNSPLALNELVFLLNSRAKCYKIHPNKKHNCFTKYLKVIHGGIVNFLDSFHIYGILTQNNKIYVQLIEEFLENEASPLKRITKDNEWVFV